MEVWRDIAGYEGQYQVSNLGNVRTLSDRHGNQRLIKPGKDSKGYLRIGLVKNGQRKTFSVHRLVAQAFIPNPLNLPEVNHVKGIKDDNRASELEWTTSSENMTHAFKTGLCSRTGLKNNKADKTCYVFNHPVHGTVSSTRFDLYTTYGLSDSNLGALIKGTRQTVAGWTLKK